VVALAAVAHADAPVDRPEAIEVDRLDEPPGRVELGFDGGAPVDSWALGAQLGFLDDPIVLRSGSIVTAPVHHRETLALGGAVSFGTSIVIDARLAVSHQVGDRLEMLGDDAGLAHWVLGDLALGARVHVAGGSRLSVFLRGELTLPTGDDHEFAGEARFTAAWLLIARATLAHGVTLAATGGIRLRAAEVDVGDRVVGDELTGGIGATVALPPVFGLWCVPDQLKLAGELVGVLGDNVSHMLGPSPVEARLGLVGQPRPDLTIGVRGGIGLDDQIGAPEVRVLVEAAWQAPAPPRPPPTAEPEPQLDDE